MTPRTARAFAIVTLLILLAVILCVHPPSAIAQQEEVYSATIIASEGVVGSSGRIRIRIVSYTTPEEKARLLEAFQRSSNTGIAVLRTMVKGYINVEGQPGRKIEAVFSRAGDGYRDLIIIGDHIASKLEKWEGVNAGEFPSAVIHLRISSEGAITGEAFPAVRLAVTPDGFVDARTDNSNRASMINIVRR